MYKNSKFLLGMWALTFLSFSEASLAGTPGKGTHLNSESQNTQKGRAVEEAQIEGDGKIIKVPEDIDSVEALQKWLKRFPEEEIALKVGATWCPPCNAMAPKLEALSKKEKGKLKVVALDVDKMSPKFKTELYQWAGGDADEVRRIVVPGLIEVRKKTERKENEKILFTGNSAVKWVSDREKK